MVHNSEYVKAALLHCQQPNTKCEDCIAYKDCTAETFAAKVYGVLQAAEAEIERLSTPQS